MPKKVPSLKAINRFGGVTVPFLLAIILLAISFATQVELASSNNDAAVKNNVSPLALQGTPTSTPTVALEVGVTSSYSFSLAALGYSETNLNSPQAEAGFAFKLPEHWSLQSDGVLELDLSYLYDQLNSSDSAAQFGALTVMLDGQTLTIFQIDRSRLDHHRLSIPLPASLLEGANHEIQLSFEASALCLIQHQAKLIIHARSSIISLDYNPGPLTLELSRYPRPFYQQAFGSDRVLFVLPTTLTTNNLNSAVGVAAKLGDLTKNRLVISATTATDLVSSLPITLNEHLIIVGQPQQNKLLPLLNETTELPVSLHQRQLEFTTQGPTAVAPGDTFSYTSAITNTLDRAVNLKVVNALSRFTELVDCRPNCQENATDSLVTWSSVALAPGESLDLALILKATGTITGEHENTITLIDNNLGPLNADTLTAQVVSDSEGSELQMSAAGQQGYFFMYNGQAVAKADGIVQEIASPWGDDQAILILTGLSDEAVHKASQAMSSGTRFPGMSGPVALVQEALAPSEFNATTSTAVKSTLAELGYEDAIVRGEAAPQIDYIFDVPYGWHLTGDAAIDLYFSHSQLINPDSGLTVLMNKIPLATIALNDQTSEDGHVHINLADANIQPGENNRLSIQATMVTPTAGGCSTPDAGKSAWLRVKKNSTIFLAHRENPQLALGLDNLPYPFDTRRDLMNVMLALPDAPTVEELAVALRLAARLGSFVTGKTILPAATVGGELPEESLADYHIIAMGRPSRNRLIQQVNGQLPQPFIGGTDEIEQRLDDVIFRLPPGVSLGYLQLFPSPWNEERAFLAVTGTTDEGVQWANQTMNGRLSFRGGNLALIKADRVSTIDTRTLTSGGVAAAVATVVPEMTPVATATAEATRAAALLSTNQTPSATAAQPTPAGRNLPSWVIPLVGVNGFIVIAILAFVYWQMQRRRL